LLNHGLTLAPLLQLQFAIGTCLSLLFWATGITKLPKFDASLVGDVPAVD
jgi:hypothetical protein